MTLAGSLHIDLQHRSGKATGVQIVSTRPDNVTQVLLGKTPEQLLDTVPLLFTLCGNAQAYAALLACRAALGIEHDPEIDSARNMLVQLETLREHTWRILLDWPDFVGLVPDKKPLTALLKFDALFKRHLFRDGEAFKLGSRLNIDAAQIAQLLDELETLINSSIFNGRLADFQALSSETELQDWLRQNDAMPAKLLNYLYSQNWMATGQNDIACLSTLNPEMLNQQLQQEDLANFSRAPQWQGRCFETTLLNRQLSQPLIAELYSRYGNGLIVRIVGRLLEVDPLQLRQLSSAQSTSSHGIGLAHVQAARGLLIHRLELHQGRVHNYRIIAPTEWNFHPEGLVAQGLKQLTATNPNDLQRQAELFINAVDPCVQYALHLTDSRNGIKKHA